MNLATLPPSAPGLLVSLLLWPLGRVEVALGPTRGDLGFIVSTNLLIEAPELPGRLRWRKEAHMVAYVALNFLLGLQSCLVAHEQPRRDPLIFSVGPLNTLMDHFGLWLSSSASWSP